MTAKDLMSLFEKTGVVTVIDQYYYIIVDSVFIEEVREKFLLTKEEECSLWESLEKIGALSMIGEGNFQLHSKCFVDDVRSKMERELSACC